MSLGPRCVIKYEDDPPPSAPPDGESLHMEISELAMTANQQRPPEAADWPALLILLGMVVILAGLSVWILLERHGLSDKIPLPLIGSASRTDG